MLQELGPVGYVKMIWCCRSDCCEFSQKFWKVKGKDCFVRPGGYSSTSPSLRYDYFSVNEICQERECDISVQLNRMLL